MIKLKSLIRENAEKFFPNGQFEYSLFAQIPMANRVYAAMEIISSNQRSLLTEPEIYHIILGVPRQYVKELYEFAIQYLTPEQLKNTKEQIKAFYR